MSRRFERLASLPGRALISALLALLLLAHTGVAALVASGVSVERMVVCSEGGTRTITVVNGTPREAGEEPLAVAGSWCPVCILGLAPVPEPTDGPVRPAHVARAEPLLPADRLLAPARLHRLKSARAPPALKA